MTRFEKARIDQYLMILEMINTKAKKQEIYKEICIAKRGLIRIKAKER